MKKESGVTIKAAVKSDYERASLDIQARIHNELLEIEQVIKIGIIVIAALLLVGMAVLS